YTIQKPSQCLPFRAIFRSLILYSSSAIGPSTPQNLCESRIPLLQQFRNFSLQVIFVNRVFFNRISQYEFSDDGISINNKSGWYRFNKKLTFNLTFTIHQKFNGCAL